MWSAAAPAEVKQIISAWSGKPWNIRTKSDFRIRGRLCMGSCRWRCELQQPWPHHCKGQSALQGKENGRCEGDSDCTLQSLLWILVSVAFPVHHQIFKDYPAVKNALTTYLPDYEKTGDVYNQLAEHTAIAIQNAKRVEQYHLQNDSSKPFGIAVNPLPTSISWWNHCCNVSKKHGWHKIVSTLAQSCPFAVNPYLLYLVQSKLCIAAAPVRSGCFQFQ